MPKRRLLCSNLFDLSAGTGARICFVRRYALDLYQLNLAQSGINSCWWLKCLPGVTRKVPDPIHTSARRFFCPRTGARIYTKKSVSQMRDGRTHLKRHLSQINNKKDSLLNHIDPRGIEPRYIGNYPADSATRRDFLRFPRIQLH